jgi:hypothetical protein
MEPQFSDDDTNKWAIPAPPSRFLDQNTGDNPFAGIEEFASDSEGEERDLSISKRQQRRLVLHKWNQ